MVLLYSTGNYIQYCVINYNRKEYEKKIHISESLCCTPETNIVNQLCFNKKLILKKRIIIPTHENTALSKYLKVEILV